MDIHQLSISYVREQDRILLRVNTSEGEELRLWLTQRLLKGLLPHLGHAAADLEASCTPLADQSEASKQLLTEFKKEETLKSADFSTPYKADAVTLPLGAEPLLVTEVTMKVLGAGQLEISFDEKLSHADNPRGFRMAVQPPLMHGMMHLLASAIATAEWGIALPAQALAAPVRDSLDFSSAERPKYLN